MNIKLSEINSAQNLAHLSESMWKSQAIMDEVMRDECRHRELQEAGAQASVESNNLLKRQLKEQEEINQRLEHEFKMGAREAVITRRIAYWSLAIGVIGVILAIISLFKGTLG